MWISKLPLPNWTHIHQTKADLLAGNRFLPLGLEAQRLVFRTLHTTQVMAMNLLFLKGTDLATNEAIETGIAGGK